MQKCALPSFIQKSALSLNNSMKLSSSDQNCVPNGAAHNWSELCTLTQHSAALYAGTAKRED
jgi:hypothetical protein